MLQTEQHEDREGVEREELNRPDRGAFETRVSWDPDISDPASWKVPATDSNPSSTVSGLVAELDEDDFDDFDEEDFDDDFDDDFEDEEDDFDYGAQELEGDLDDSEEE